MLTPVKVRPLHGDNYRFDGVDTCTLTEYSAKLRGIPGVEFDVSTRGVLEAIRFHRNVFPVLQSLCSVSPIFPGSSTSTFGSRSLFTPPFALRDYQQDAVRFCDERQGTLLFHDLGMGKTAMALSAARPPLLVVAPATAMYGWVQASEAYGMRVALLRGTSKGKIRSVKEQGADCFITTYQSASQWIPYFRTLGVMGALHTLIADEVHYLHRAKLSWSQAWGAISCQQRLGLTATPLRNRMPSLWGCLNAINPKGWGKRHEFLERYSGASQGPYGMVVGDLTEADELIARMAEVSIRRSLEEQEFYSIRPPLERQPIRIHLSKQERSEMFSSARKGVASRYIRGNCNPTQLRYLNQQRQESGKAKLRWLMKRKEQVKGELETNVRTLWWFWYKEQSDTFAAWLKQEFPEIPCDRVDGRTTPTARARILREWEHGSIHEPRVLVGSIGALNAAANLLTCKAAYFVELDWAPINMVQAEKRHHRPGSKFDKVEAYYLVIEDSIDSDIADKLLVKVAEAEELFGKSGTVSQIESLFDDSLYVNNVLEED